MLIVCPACASAYEIDAERVGSDGRSVRCAACRETWFVSPDDVATAIAESTEFDGSLDETFATRVFGAQGRDTGASEPEREPDAGPVVDQPLPYPRRAGPAAKRVRKVPIPSAALVAGLIVFVAVPLGLLGRSAVVRAMPQSAGLFAALGLPVNLRGVELRDVVAFQTPAEDGKPGQLVVEGDLVGIARERVDVPAIAVEVRDARDQALYRWTVPAPRPALEAAETARFRASLSAPPMQGRSVGVRFADAAIEPGRAEHVDSADAATASHPPAHDH